jgi:hypothetical protein
MSPPPLSAGLPSAGPPTAGQPSAGPPTSGQPSAGPPTSGQPSAGPPTSGQPSAGPPSTKSPVGGPPGSVPALVSRFNTLYLDLRSVNRFVNLKDLKDFRSANFVLSTFMTEFTHRSYESCKKIRKVSVRWQFRGFYGT